MEKHTVGNNKRCLGTWYYCNLNAYYFREEEFHLDLDDGGNDDLIKKNKKRKPLGSINLRITMNPMTKEEMNEVYIFKLLVLSFTSHIHTLTNISK